METEYSNKAHVHRHGISHSHDAGNAPIDYYAVNSGIRRWTPEFKVGFSILLLLICLLADQPVLSMIILATSCVITVGFGKLPLTRYLSVLTIPIAFILMGSLAIGIEFASEPIGDWNLFLHWGYLVLTRTGIRKMFALMLKAFAAISAMFIMTLSTPSFEIFAVLKKAHCPQLVIELMHMIYRFIFILLSVQRSMRISAESRLGFCDFQTGCSSFGQIAGNLFIVSLKKAGAAFDAMESRCYDGTFAFLEEEREKNPKRVLAAAVYFLVLIAIWVCLKLLQDGGLFTGIGSQTGILHGR